MPEGNGYERPDALYVFGVDDMSTSDVMKVFQTYSPNHLEWVNDQSCEWRFSADHFWHAPTNCLCVGGIFYSLANPILIDIFVGGILVVCSGVIVWEDTFSAKRALFALGRWELDRSSGTATRGEDSSTDLSSSLTSDTGWSARVCWGGGGGGSVCMCVCVCVFTCVGVCVWGGGGGVCIRPSMYACVYLCVGACGCVCTC